MTRDVSRLKRSNGVSSDRGLSCSTTEKYDALCKSSRDCQSFGETMENTIRILAFRLDLFRQFGQPNSGLYLRLFAGADLDKTGRAPESALRSALLKCLREPLAHELSNTER